ncbi:hypothetical protein J1N35_011708 [Gossypium stocksii]|uniref:Uncharacterized protein n=1 Tax=Gossypium stocksii TaxID=47602 RepID=A0A9D4ADL6_9ROSI|nr:hypothetical protein J1N35_011708 [Gossypium stocksii]
MDSEGTQGREGLPIFLELENAQETEVKVSPPTSGSDNPELGIEALTRLGAWSVIRKGIAVRLSRSLIL